MNKSITRIISVLVLIILLPILFFSVIQITSLNKNEKIVEEIYNKQLETILFSVNQYTDDVIRNWVEELNLKINYSNKENVFLDFFENKNQINAIICSDNIQGKNFSVYKNSLSFNEINKNQLIELLNENSGKIEKLYKYMQGKYRKIEPIIDIENLNNNYLLFLTGKGPDYKICGFQIDPQRFISEVLSPRIQYTSEDKFYITVSPLNSDSVIYSSDIDTLFTGGLQLKKEIWLFPGYELGIQLKGKTIADLIGERTKINIVLLIILNLILITGVWFIYRNIKKEVKLAQIKSEFISNVSHEIRTPLALISMYIETLEMGRVKGEKINEYYSVINQETTRLSGIVNKILNFSKIESGKRNFKFELLDLNEVVNNVMKSYNFHLSSKGFNFNQVLHPNLPKITLDKEAASDAFINLLDNAIKYSKDEKYIEVNTGMENGFAFIEVKDKGVGISKENQKQIFDKFYRVTEGNLAHHAKGSGLGLSIVKGIMDAHKVKIEINSTLGKGSIFKLKFPLKH